MIGCVFPFVCVCVWAWLAQQVDNLAGFCFLFCCSCAVFPIFRSLIRFANDLLSATGGGRHSSVFSHQSFRSSRNAPLINTNWLSKTSRNYRFPTDSLSHFLQHFLYVLLLYLFSRLWHSFYCYKSSASHVQCSLPSKITVSVAKAKKKKQMLFRLYTACQVGQAYYQLILKLP